MTTTPKFRLRLKSLKFCSVVDLPAQEVATLRLLKSASNGDDFAATARFVKSNDELGLAFFWAFQSTTSDGEPYGDLQGDILELDQGFMKAAMDFMLDGGAVDEMHDGQEGAGRVIFAMPITKETVEAFDLGDVKASGLMIGMKPRPDVLAKLKSGEYAGVSIQGSGTRELLKTADVDDVDAKLAANRAQLEKQAADVIAKAKADEAYTKRLIADSLAYLDKLAADHGFESAARVAKANMASIGNWGQVWLTAHADDIAKAADVAKANEPGPIDFIEKRRADYDALVTKYATEKKCSHLVANEAVFNSDEGAKAYADGWSSMFSSVEKVARSFDARIAAKTAEIDKMIETFALDHNLDPSKARQRLEAVSPTFVKATEQLSEIYGERVAAATKAQNDLEAAWMARGTAAQNAKNAEIAAATKAAADRAKRAPEDVQLESMAKGYAIANKCTVVEAYGALMETSPEARELYNQGEARKSERRAGI